MDEESSDVISNVINVKGLSHLQVEGKFFPKIENYQDITNLALYLDSKVQRKQFGVLCKGLGRFIRSAKLRSIHINTSQYGFSNFAWAMLRQPCYRCLLIMQIRHLSL